MRGKSLVCVAAPLPGVRGRRRHPRPLPQRRLRGAAAAASPGPEVQPHCNLPRGGKKKAETWQVGRGRARRHRRGLQGNPVDRGASGLAAPQCPRGAGCCGPGRACEGTTWARTDPEARRAPPGNRRSKKQGTVLGRRRHGGWGRHPQLPRVWELGLRAARSSRPEDAESCAFPAARAPGP